MKEVLAYTNMYQTAFYLIDGQLQSCAGFGCYLAFLAFNKIKNAKENHKKSKTEYTFEKNGESYIIKNSTPKMILEKMGIKHNPEKSLVQLKIMAKPINPLYFRLYFNKSTNFKKPNLPK